MSTPHSETSSIVSWSWVTSAVGWFWQWFVGDASGMSILLGLATTLLTCLKIAQEVQAWRARDEEHQALRKLWEKVSRRSRPIPLDSRVEK